MVYMKLSLFMSISQHVFPRPPYMGLKSFFVRSFFFTIFFTTVEIPTALAEPWLGTRFAQNCAGCHAPGRKNLPPVLRRCSLSCQGCHVNPNGGGMRSFYGKWNEDKWLRSFRVKKLGQERLPAPLHRQHYGKNLKAKPKPQTLKKVADHGLPMVLSDKEFEQEMLYDRHHDKFYYVNATSTDDYKYTIPKDDPYRLMDATKIDGGGDFRLFAYRLGRGEDKKVRHFLMEASFGLRYRPLRNTHIVYESRYFGPPVGQQIDQIPGQEQTRSMYIMQDDLPWNIYAMGGYYKPLFGNYTPDHTALAQVMTSLLTTGQGNIAKALYKAVSFGTAPNVPFANLHYITKRVGTTPNNDETGYAGNIGLRFVSFGGQVNYSFWSTNDTSVDNDPKKIEMHAFELRAAYLDYIFGMEAISFAKDQKLEDFREGGLITAEGRYRFWRENYASLELANANVARDLSPGFARQIKVGTKHFLIPGLEISTQYSIDEGRSKPTAANPNTAAFKQNTLSLMIHTYF